MAKFSKRKSTVISENINFQWPQTSPNQSKNIRKIVEFRFLTAISCQIDPSKTIRGLKATLAIRLWGYKSSIFTGTLPFLILWVFWFLNLKSILNLITILNPKSIFNLKSIFSLKGILNLKSGLKYWILKVF